MIFFFYDSCWCWNRSSQCWGWRNKFIRNNI